MRNRRSSLKRFGLPAALVLLLFQSFAFGLSAGAAALPASLDAFGNPLCAHSEHGGGSGHPTIPDCCTVACGIHLPALPVGTVEAVVLRHHAGILAPVAASRLVFPSAPDHDPGRPRAPPVA